MTAPVPARVHEHAGRDGRSDRDSDQERDGIGRGHDGTIRQLVDGAVASLREPRTTMGGANLVAGFRRELWRDVMPEHGTMFVGFCATQEPLVAILDSMAGRTTGVRDALTRFTEPLGGAYYFVPSAEALTRASETTTA